MVATIRGCTGSHKQPLLHSCRTSRPEKDGSEASETQNCGRATATAARHFTLYGLRHAEGPSALLGSGIPERLHRMNPMFWWIRLGTKDSGTSPTVSAGLAARLRNLGDDVDIAYYWDAGTVPTRSRGLHHVDGGDFGAPALKLTYVARKPTA
ncbi:hypothetical protein AB0D38_36545 [Streptomyces sp. NPDC048279]|uniref:hypothetical protein n=1 Tax=Streptomyces sp. NPDC048279 TaxID=3154714 RepID=UPI00341DF987